MNRQMTIDPELDIDECREYKQDTSDCHIRCPGHYMECMEERHKQGRCFDNCYYCKEEEDEC